MLYAPVDRLTHDHSYYLVFGLFGVVLVLGVAALCVLAWWSRAQARGADAQVTPIAAFRAGRVLFAGAVELVPGERDAPVLLTLQQHGEQRRSKNGQFVLWTETGRWYKTRPFYLRLENGALVRVEPGKRVDLVDALELPTRDALSATRTRHARLGADEKVWLGGHLSLGLDPLGLATQAARPAGYREAPHQHWVLKPSPGRRLFASSEPVSKRFNDNAKFYLGWALGWLALGALIHGVAFREYHQLRRHGVDAMAQVLSTDRYQTRTKNGYVTHYVAVVASPYAPSQTVREEVSADAWVRLQESLASVPVVVDRRHPESLQIGGRRELGSTIVGSLLAYFAFFVAFGGMLYHGFWRRPWYTRKKFNETEPGSLYGGA